MRISGWIVCAGLCVGSSLPAQAVVSTASIFGNGMVLQREQTVPVWGMAAPGEPVSVDFGGQTVSTKADADGKWTVSLEPMKADASPRALTITGAGSSVVFEDVLVGEVWLCSGQSNMGLEVRKCLNASNEVAAATNPVIRGFTVQYAPGIAHGYTINPTQAAQRFALTPQDNCLGKWQHCTPDNTRNWSAVGYFFARDVQQRLQVPVGIIVSSAGATAIEAWTSVDGLKAVPTYRERAEAFDAVARAYLSDTNSLQQALDAWAARCDERSRTWFAELDAEDPGLSQKWMNPSLDSPLDLSAWGDVTLPVSVANNPLGAPKASIWFRKEVAIPGEWVGKELELHLGVVDSVDEAYANGQRIGRTWFDTPNYWSLSRVYTVPATAATTNRVSLSLRLLKLAYPMGLFGPAEEMKLVPKGMPEAVPVSLAGDWKMRKAQDLDPGRQPQPPPLLGKRPGNYYGHPGVMYNGLIHPVIPYAIRGAIWYQGEANAPFYEDYRSLLPGLIASWRREWGQGDFPFGIVQLADYWGQQTKPVERGGYTPLREAQALALSVTNTFLATAVGVGEGNDIHPKNKQEVGRRLALNALGSVYGLTDRLRSGPVYRSMDVEGSTIRLSFDFAKGLHARGEPPVGFAIAGADRTFYFAKAKIEGETVVVWSDKVPKPVAVRYAWATNPVCNLYNADELPIFQFHTDAWDHSQFGIADDVVTLPAGWVPK